MYKLILLSVFQSLCLVAGNAFLKLTLERIGKFHFAFSYIKQFLLSPLFLLCGICMGGATILWLYILKHYPFSAAYPLISISYLFGLIISWLVFKEPIPFLRWIGVVFIILGVILVVQK